MNKLEKLSWKGTIISIQPRISLLRSFDQRQHNYFGYVLCIKGKIDVEDREFTIGVGKAAHGKHQFQLGNVVSGQSQPVEDIRKEPVEFYKTSKLQVIERTLVKQPNPPPWLGIPPELEEYRERGHRRLDARTYGAKCLICIWGCRMPVEMTIDHWNPEKKRYRFETFCYGPKSCPLYKAGATRKVPGRKGMTWEESDWVDEEAVSHREMDE